MERQFVGNSDVFFYIRSYFFTKFIRVYSIINKISPRLYKFTIFSIFVFREFHRIEFYLHLLDFCIFEYFKGCLFITLMWIRLQIKLHYFEVLNSKRWIWRFKLLKFFNSKILNNSIFLRNDKSSVYKELRHFYERN